MDAFSAQTGLHPIAIPTPFPVGPVNVFLWKGSPLTLIDAGPRTDEGWLSLEHGIESLGVRVAEIERVILTHHHVDHIGLLRRVMDASGAESWAHPGVRSEDMPHERAEEDRRQFYLSVMREFGVPADTQEQSMALWGAFKQFSEPFVINYHFEDAGSVGPFRTYFVPGHSATDTLLVHETDGYTIVGDHILEVTNPNPLLRPPREAGAPRPHSLVEYQASLRRSLGLELGRCFPGHGGPIDDHRPVAEGILARHARRNRRILEALGESEITPYALARQLYPDLPLAHLYLALSVATGHLEVLESEGALSTEHRDGVIHYRRAAGAAA